MNSTKLRNLRLADAAAVVAAGVCGAIVALRLDGYGVPFGLTVACGFGAASTLSALLMRLVERLGTATYACQVEDCTFRAELKAASAVDHRRWQEAAAAHPAHALPRP
ncbi:hypothetical protein ABZ946_11775 [Streptomyces sp. NPDC046324]|uniref:hypothetical protein n=1 Tax=Streptomyces sp. NPDC046324 TaxID=3154915 RepID=UPI0033D624A9